MVKILVNLSEKEDKIVEIYKVVNSLKTKQEAIKHIIEFFEVRITPRNLGASEEYYQKATKIGEK